MLSPALQTFLKSALTRWWRICANEFVENRGQEVVAVVLSLQAFIKLGHAGARISTAPRQYYLKLRLEVESVFGWK